MDKNLQPIIILGMHRSGTTMLINMLQQLGMFVGKNLDPNCEPEFFIKLNDWVLNQAGAAWDNPEAMSSYFNPASAEVTSLTVDYLETILKSLQVSSFIGIDRILQGTTPFKIEGVWGWKDPRNTWTLPLWLKIFPNAKVLHIYRHGVDVAASLRFRERAALIEAKNKHTSRKCNHVYDLFQRKTGFAGSVRCHDLTSAYALWELYITKALSYEHSIENQIMNVKYEDFLANPTESLTSIARFCGLESTNIEIEEATKGVNPSRGLSFVKDVELSKFWEKRKMLDLKLLLKLGYLDDANILKDN